MTASSLLESILAENIADALAALGADTSLVDQVRERLGDIAMLAAMAGQERDALIERAVAEVLA
jgi:hypothetical protein